MKSAKYCLYVILLAAGVISFSSLSYSQDFFQIGLDKLSKKDYQGAIENFKKAVEKTPKSSKAYFYLAEAYYMEDQFDNAEVNLKRSIDYDDENAQALKRLGDVYYQKGLYRDAIKEYDKALKLEKRNPEFLLAMGKAMIEIDSIDKAVSVLSLAKEIDSKNSPLFVALGDAYLKMGVAPMAIDNYKKSVEIDTTSPEAHIRLGDVYMNKLKMYREGLNEYIKGVLLDSTNLKVLRKVSHLLYYNRYYQVAADFYKKYVNQVDTSYQAYWELGYSLIYTTPPQLDLSIKMLNKAIKLSQKPVEAVRYLALAQFFALDFKSSIKTYDNLAKIDTISISEYHNLARAHMGIKDTVKGLEYYIKITDINPKYNPGYDIFNQIAVIYQKRKMYKEAGDFLMKKAEADTTNERSKFYHLAGQSMFHGKNYDGAAAAFNKSIEIKSDEYLNLYYLGLVYIGYQKNDSTRKGVDYFKEFTTSVVSAGKEKDFKSYLEESYNRLALYEFSTTKNYAKSLEYFQKCIKYDERNADYWLMSAYCYTQLNQKEDACKAADRASKINPKCKAGKDALELRKKLNCWAYE